MFISMDLDDTLLKTDKSISDYSLNVLKRLKELGHIIIINTARNLERTDKYINAIQADFTICNAGSLIVDKNKNIIYSDPISKEVTNEIVTKLLKETNVISIQTLDILYNTNKDYLSTHLKEKYRDSDYYLDAYKIMPYKLNKDVALEIVKMYDVNYTSYFGGNWSRFSKNPNDKLHGLKVVVDYCGADMKETISFGDDYGDLPMLEGSFIGVAMQNSIADVLKNAKHVCESCDDDGVAKFLNEYFKLGVENL